MMKDCLVKYLQVIVNVISLNRAASQRGYLTRLILTWVHCDQQFTTTRVGSKDAAD